MKKYKGIFLKDEAEIGRMRESGKVVARILRELGGMVAPGVATIDFEMRSRELCEELGVTPAFLGYRGYRFALCCSVNEEIVHGFPSERELKEGDIVSFDMGVVRDGFYADAAVTFPVGETDEEAARLIAATREALAAGIEQAVPGNRLYDISRAVQKVVDENGFSVIERFVGHGIGRKLHEKPEVPNSAPAGSPGIDLAAGMCLAIEPMAAAGAGAVKILDDRWTAVTRDSSLAAHFEHTVALTVNGPEILSADE